MITSSGEPIMYEAIRTPNKLVLVVLNTKAHGYSNLICHIYIAGKHWDFEGQKVARIGDPRWYDIVKLRRANWQRYGCEAR